jgi:hypothetical protein
MPRLAVYVLIPLAAASLLFAGWTGLAAINAAPADPPKPGANYELKSNLVGSYVVTGTDLDGEPYAAPHIVEASLAPSGAIELNWDDGKNFGVGQIIGNALAVSCLTKGRTTILVMEINPDGSLSGKWLRRTERGYKGTEAWKKIL